MFHEERGNFMNYYGNRLGENAEKKLLNDRGGGALQNFVVNKLKIGFASVDC